MKGIGSDIVPVEPRARPKADARGGQPGLRTNRRSRRSTVREIRSEVLTLASASGTEWNVNKYPETTVRFHMSHPVRLEAVEAGVAGPGGRIDALHSRKASGIPSVTR